MIEPSERLRRAIQLDSLSLVKRILASNVESQTLLRNYDEAGNTSLHLAAQLGHADIAVSSPFSTTRSISQVDERADPNNKNNFPNYYTTSGTSPPSRPRKHFRLT